MYWQQFLEHEEQLDRIRKAREAKLDALAEAALAGEDPPCECVQVDVDIMDASRCPIHGRNNTAALQREAEELVAYYAAEIPELKPITRRCVELRAPEFRGGRVA